MAQNNGMKTQIEVSVSEGQVGFIKDQIGTFEDCTVEYNHSTAKVLLRGNNDKVTARRIKILTSLSEVREQSIELSAAQKAILDQEKGRLFLKDYLNDFHFYFKNEELVVLTKNFQELEKNIQALASRLNGKEHVALDNDVSEGLAAALQQIEEDSDLLVKLSHDEKSITIEGVREDVAIAKRKILEMKDEFLLISDSFSVDGQVAVFIKSHLLDKFYNLFSDIKVENKLNQTEKLLASVKGTKSKVAEVKSKFKAFVGRITLREMDYSLSPPQAYLLSKGMELYTSVRDKIKAFEIEKKCSVIFRVNSTEVTTADDSMNNDLSSRAAVSAAGEIVINLSDSCKLHIKNSKDITNENSDVLVCPIMEETNQHTTVLNRFKNLCPGIIEELASEKEKNPSSRTYVTRQSLGNLRCKAVVHVVLKKSRDPSSDQDLKQQIVNALQQAVMLGTEAKSISFPVMGYGRAFKFSVQSAARIAVDAVKLFVRSSPTSSLTDIVFLAPEDTLFKQFQQCLGSSSAPAAEKRRAPPVNFDVLVAGTKDTDFVQIKSELWRELEVNCLGYKEFNQDILKDFPSDFHKEVMKEAKRFGVWVEKNKGNKAGYRIWGTVEGKQQLIGAIQTRLTPMLKQFENRIKFFKEKRGTIEFIRRAAKSDDDFPSYWSVKSSNEGSQASKKVNVGKQTSKAIQDMIQKLFNERNVGTGSDAQGLSHKSIKVIKIKRLENCDLFAKYAFQRRRLLMRKANEGHACSDIRKLKSAIESLTSSSGVASTENLESFMTTELLCHEINEHYLFHGCGDLALADISNNGFDPRVSNPGMLGRATYFAENPTKSDQYADVKGSRSPVGTKLKMILARVLLGDTFLCGKDFVTNAKRGPTLVRPPCKACFKTLCRCRNKKHFDSVMGQGWLFREFVIYDGDVCYPEYIITYVRE
ncbi:uncharacterized protein LOC101851461 [Aplysia californica]|uniref:Poly [ADP-ribose] polymerase n=1 Tax=Aplysia californica TaxID=6500 RepID=A0ABM0K9F5_APLCA|nr:uncharacterized protein LOC101851461 [Aplysia californica]